jgi:hypothetical protein
VVIGNNIYFIRGDPLDIALGVVEDIPVIDDDLVEVLVQQVPEHTRRLGLLAQDLGRSDRTLQVVLDHLPGGDQLGQVFVQLRGILSLRRRPDNDAEIFGFDGFHDLLQPFALIRGMDLTRDSHNIIKGSNDDETTR